MDEGLLRGTSADPKRVCVTRAELRKKDDNSLWASATLIDREGESKKILRVAVPLGVQLVYGTRLIVDRNDPMPGPYTLCNDGGCAADYEATPALLDRMKTGRWLTAQAIDQSGKPLNATLWLNGFWAAHTGPPSEPVAPIMEPRQKPWLDDTLRPELRPRER